MKTLLIVGIAWLVSVPFLSNGQLSPKRIFVEAGNNNFKKHGSSYSNKFNYIQTGAEWSLVHKNQLGLDVALSTGFFFPNYDFIGGIRPYLVVPVNIHYYITKKLRVGAGFFIKRDFYLADQSGERDLHSWEIYLKGKANIGYVATMRYSVFSCLEFGLHFNYMPILKAYEIRDAKVVSNYKSIGPQLSLYYKMFKE